MRTTATPARNEGTALTEAQPDPALTVEFVFVFSHPPRYEACLYEGGYLLCVAAGGTREKAESAVRAAWDLELAETFLPIAE